MNSKNYVTANDTTEEKIQLVLNQKERKKEKIIVILPFMGLAFLFVFFSIGSKGVFLSPSNMTNLINQCYSLTMVAIGAAFVYANGGMDMSIGAVFALGQLIMSYAIHAGAPVLLAMLACIGVAVLCSSIVANVHIWLNVPVFICSMCMMNICNGLVNYAVSDADIRVSYSQYSYLNSPSIKAVMLVIMIGLGYWLFQYTMLGKGLKALGGNEAAAKICGIKRNIYVWLGFLVLGICIGLSAIFSLMRTGVVSGATGSGMNLNILVAIVLGGFPLTGGSKCRLIAPVVGALMVTVLVNGIQILGFNTAVANMSKGILFLIVIAVTYDRSKGILVS